MTGAGGRRIGEENRGPRGERATQARVAQARARTPRRAGAPPSPRGRRSPGAFGTTPMFRPGRHRAAPSARRSAKAHAASGRGGTKEELRLLANRHGGAARRLTAHAAAQTGRGTRRRQAAHAPRKQRELDAALARPGRRETERELRVKIKNIATRRAGRRARFPCGGLRLPQELTRDAGPGAPKLARGVALRAAVTSRGPPARREARRVRGISSGRARRRREVRRRGGCRPRVRPRPRAEPEARGLGVARGSVRPDGVVRDSSRRRGPRIAAGPRRRGVPRQRRSAHWAAGPGRPRPARCSPSPGDARAAGPGRRRKSRGRRRRRRRRRRPGVARADPARRQAAERFRREGERGGGGWPGEGAASGAKAAPLADRRAGRRDAAGNSNPARTRRGRALDESRRRRASAPPKRRARRRRGTRTSTRGSPRTKF